MKNISAALSASIQRHIDDLAVRAAQAGNWPTRVSKDELNALPLHANSIYMWSLRPDGVVLCMDHESFGHATEPETDPVMIYAVLLHGATTYPDLVSLVPDRPAAAKPCNSCNATGMVKRESETIEGCLGCSGLGWYTAAGRQ